MDRFRRFTKHTAFLLSCLILLSSCLQSDIPRASKVYQSDGTKKPDDSNSKLPIADEIPRVELRHLIQPNFKGATRYSNGIGLNGGGSYVTKLSLPKNYDGYLYLAGINVSSLMGTHVTVRFRFGLNRHPVDVPATISQAPGITPQTNINVLVMDLRGAPFRDLILPYDLYDYKDYEIDPVTHKILNTESIIQDNLDTNLYCRGLALEDDPTFTGVGACDGVQEQNGQPAEECLYAYAQVDDQSLIKISNLEQTSVTPTFPQVKSTTSANYYADNIADLVLRPSLDTIPTSSTDPHQFSSYLFRNDGTDEIRFDSFTGITFPDGHEYRYRGPYRLRNTLNWHFNFTDLDGPKRLFRKGAWVHYDSATYGRLPDDPAMSTHLNYFNRLYYNSYKYPLMTKMDLNAGVGHLSSNDLYGPRNDTSLTISGETQWMDGSNARAQGINNKGEHIGSCNVTSTLEVLAKDENGNLYVVASTIDVKLQLVRPTLYQTDSGNQVLYENYKRCTSNSTCGSGECCFTDRCWSSTLVSQCFNEGSTQGSRNTGATCSSDLECKSLCCNSGRCADHNTIAGAFCNKPSGTTCIAKEWCQKVPITRCFIIRTGTTSTGKVTCAQQCYQIEEHGECMNGLCMAPTQPTIPTFDPEEEGACDGAIAPPNF